MKKITVLLLCILALTGRTALRADEGMWIPMLIGKNYEQMKKQGFKLTAEDLYSANKASLKDAIVHFGGFCTGEIVSDKGLIFTNHHCGYDAIASNSTPQNNILDNGFYAKNYGEEKPIPGLFVRFLKSMKDVTPEVEAKLKGLSGAERTARLPEVLAQMGKYYTKGENIIANVRDFYKSNQFILMVYEQFNDVRLVGNPPQSVGKFGGDTDNWIWPRHTGDFSIFRVYAGKNNESAAYSPGNVPYVPKRHIPVSIKGVKNGDFSIVYGYPGRTDRYLTSYGVDLAVNKVNPTTVKLRDIRLKAWKAEMNKSVETRLNLSAKYANIANYWKYYIGQTEQLKKLGIQAEKQKEEAAFTSWAQDKPEYSGLMNKYAAIYSKMAPLAVRRTYLAEGFMATAWVQLVQQLPAVAERIKESPATAGQLKSRVTEFINGDYKKEYNETADKKIFAQILAAYYNDVAKDEQPAFYKAIVQKYWKGNAEATFSSYADYLWANSKLIKPSDLTNALGSMSAEQIKADPAYQYAVNLVPATYIKENFGNALSDFEEEKANLDHLYLKAILEKNKGKLMYPDANSTMRITYGNVQNYTTPDGKVYPTTTNIQGVLAKYKPNDAEFDLPANLIKQAKAHNFGQYGSGNTLVVNFITNNDITGGNSGSPVINGNGELIGLAFDGNWEAMSGDIAFDKKYKRTICVDVRYVLWCIDILGGAKNIIAELKLTKPATTVKPAVRKAVKPKYRKAA